MQKIWIFVYPAQSPVFSWKVTTDTREFFLGFTPSMPRLKTLFRDWALRAVVWHYAEVVSILQLGVEGCDARHSRQHRFSAAHNCPSKRTAYCTLRWWKDLWKGKTCSAVPSKCKCDNSSRCAKQKRGNPTDIFGDASVIIALQQWASSDIPKHPPELENYINKETSPN